MVKLYVEGGGDSKNLKIQCQEGFRTFLKNIGLKENPRIVACGGRNNAYERFRTAIKMGNLLFYW